MNSAERQIDHALHVLRHATPRDGINQRLLARLQDHAAAPAPSWRPALIFVPPAATLLTAALLFVLFHHAQRTNAPAITQTTSQAAPTVDLAAPQHTQPFINSSLFHVSANPFASTSDQSADIDPAYLPSFPAPEAPLTADERRLARLARHPATYDVAQLEAPPESLARQSQDAIGDFIHHMLAPLITAESFSPTTTVELDPPPPAQPEPQPDSTSSPQ